MKRKRNKQQRKKKFGKNANTKSKTFAFDCLKLNHCNSRTILFVYSKIDNS